MVDVEIKFFKELVLGFVVVEKITRRDAIDIPTINISTHAITSFTNELKGKFATNIEGGNDIDSDVTYYCVKGEEWEDSVSVKGILPAPFPTYQISAFVPNRLEVLGYEYPTLPTRSWHMALLDRLKEKQASNNQGFAFSNDQKTMCMTKAEREIEMNRQFEEYKEYLVACIEACFEKIHDIISSAIGD